MGSRKIFPVIDDTLSASGCTVRHRSLRNSEDGGGGAADILVDSIALLIKYYITVLYKKRGRPTRTQRWRKGSWLVYDGEGVAVCGSRLE